MTRPALFLVAMLVVLSACGGPGSFTGKVAGASLTVQDAVFTLTTDNNGKTTGAALLMADKTGLCDALKAGKRPASMTGTYMLFTRKQDTFTVLAPSAANYTVYNNLANFLLQDGDKTYTQFVSEDANCTSTLSASQSVGQSGLVKVSALKSEKGGTLAAEFDIVFGTQGDAVKGSVTATWCEGAQVTLNLACLKPAS